MSLLWDVLKSLFGFVASAYGFGAGGDKAHGKARANDQVTALKVENAIVRDDAARDDSEETEEIRNEIESEDNGLPSFDPAGINR